ncbi:MAG: DUF5908 family protein [Methylophilus sp.]|jgi:hypothetical protein
MPIEIKELHIKVTVNSPQSQSSDSTVAGSTAADIGADVNTIVAECVEQVLEILKHKAER